MHIKQVIFSPGLTGFYFDDQKAIKAGAEQDGFAYLGQPATDGFRAVRQAGESVSVQIVLSDGQVAYGDCAAVQYSGAGGRDPLFLADEFIPVLKAEVAPQLVGRTLDSFRDLAAVVDGMRRPNGHRLHTAARYGVTQAVLDAVARAKRITMAEVIAREYQGTRLVAEPVPIFCQTGDDRYANADKIIIKRAQVLPHGLINNVAAKLGRHGELLEQYVTWLKNRVYQLGGAEYRPTLHIDVYGTIGLAFDNDLTRMADYLGTLEKAAAPLSLRIEGAMDAGSEKAQIEQLGALTRELHRRGIGVQMVADEWCNTLEDIVEFTDAQACDMVQIKTPDLGGINNTIEAVLYCKEHGMGAYLGGTCNETERSAQACVHVALATRPDQMLAKPGMGVDEGLSVVYNEMQRAIALLRARSPRTEEEKACS